MSYSEVVSGVLAMTGVAVGAALTVFLQDRSEERRRMRKELDQLQVLRSHLLEATSKLIHHRAYHDDKFALIDGKTVEKTNPSSEEFRLALTSALEAFPFPLSDLDGLESPNVWGGAAIAAALILQREVADINDLAAALSKNPGPSKQDVGDFLSQAAFLVDHTNLINSETLQYETLLKAVFSLKDRPLGNREKRYIEEHVEELKRSSEGVYASEKNVRDTVSNGSESWQSFLQKIDWPKI